MKKGFVIAGKAQCLNCGVATQDRPICDNCVGEAVDAMSHEDLLKTAKLGMVALVDEATEYQKIRAKDDLYQLYFKHLKGVKIESLRLIR